jgi:ABC-type glycerol-3-phosphate transport system substrate-binding protein
MQQSLFHASNRRSTRLLHLILLLTLLLLLGACNDPTPTPSPTSLPQTDPTPVGQSEESAPAIVSSEASGVPTPNPIAGTVVLWHSWAGSDADALDDILADFRRHFPNLAVETLFVAYDDLPQAYADAVQAGQGPDLVVVPNWWLGDLVSASVLAPLTEIVDPQQIAGYWPATLENMSWNGVLYGLPVNYELVSLYANRSLVPSQAFPKNTAEMLALAQQAPELGSGLYANLYHLFWGIPAYGSRMLDADGRVILDQTNGTGDFLAWLTALDQTPGSYVSSDYGMLLDRVSRRANLPLWSTGPGPDRSCWKRWGTI